MATRGRPKLQNAEKELVDNGSIESSQENHKSSDPSTMDLMKMIQKLTQELESLKQEKKTIEVSKIEEETDLSAFEDEGEDIKIASDSRIKVMSLLPWELNLVTKINGKIGKIFKFNYFGQVKKIIYADLIDILEVNQSFLEKFYFIILDKRVIKAHGLQDLYATALTKEMIEQILNGNDKSDVISLFTSANKFQQEVIIQMLIDKMINNIDSIDLNLIDKLSRISGVNINEKYQTTKRYVDLRSGKVDEK